MDVTRTDPRREPVDGSPGSTPDDGLVARYLRRWWSPRARNHTLWRLIYLWVTLAAAVLWFAVVLIGLVLGASLAIVTVGLPILTATFVVARHAAEYERQRARTLLGVEVVTPPERPVEGGWSARFRSEVTDPVAWRAVAFHLVAFVVHVVTATVALAWWVQGAWMLLTPVISRTIPALEDVLWEGNRLDSPQEWIGIPLLGVVLLVTAPLVTAGCAALSGGLVRALLGASRADLADRAARLAAQRDRSEARAAAERRKIERDLHDGAQARLVSLAVDLGRARERLDAGDAIDDVERIVSSAHEQTRLALAELRDLARGVHPAVLTDRGLDAAFSALAARTPVPAEVTVRVPVRPSPTVEAAAYFVVTEALTNLVRHGSATRAVVSVERSGDDLAVEVRDDGSGGAVERPGGGLAGLRDRVEALDGWFQVTSPAGGPTVVTAVLPAGRA
jgi:signal transduction histidine kinase